MRPPELRLLEGGGRAGMSGPSVPVPVPVLEGERRSPGWTPDQRVRISAGEIVPLAGRIALALMIAGGVVAIVVGLTVAGQAREGLGFRFPGVPGTVGTFATILATNLRMLAGVFVVFAIGQVLARTPDGPTVTMRGLRALLELVVLVEVVLNTLMVGVSVGAYGGRMVLALLPHGPVELAGDALALALLLAGRRRRLPVRGMVAWVAVSVGLLLLAAVLETWVAL